RRTITVAEPRPTGPPHDRSPQQHCCERNDRGRRDPPAAHLTGQLFCTQLLEVREDLFRALITKFSFRLKQLDNDSVEPWIDTDRSRWRPLPRFERALSSSHFVEHRSKRKQVGSSIHALAPGLFGRHVANRS